MAWTVPSDRSVGELITATIWNQNLGLAGNSKYLKDAVDGKQAKVLWVPVSAGSYTLSQNFGGECFDGDDAYMHLWIPSDFTAVTTAGIVVRPLATQGSANWDITSYFAAIGEAYNTHSLSDAASTYNVTDDQMFEVDVSGILTGLAAGDWLVVRILVSTAGHNVGVHGLKITYS